MNNEETRAKARSPSSIDDQPTTSPGAVGLTNALTRIVIDVLDRFPRSVSTADRPTASQRTCCLDVLTRGITGGRRPDTWRLRSTPNLLSLGAQSASCALRVQCWRVTTTDWHNATCHDDCNNRSRHYTSSTGRLIVQRDASTSSTVYVAFILMTTVAAAVIWRRWQQRIFLYFVASLPTLSADSSQCRTQRRDWYSVSVDPTTSRMHSLASTGCECLKGLFSRSPCRFIRLSTAMPRSTYGSSHRSPTSSLDKDCGLLHPTIYLFLLLDCLYYWSLSSCLNSLSPALA